MTTTATPTLVIMMMMIHIRKHLHIYAQLHVHVYTQNTCRRVHRYGPVVMVIENASLVDKTWDGGDVSGLHTNIVVKKVTSWKASR